MLAWHLQQLDIIIKLTGPKWKLPESDHMVFRRHCTGFFPVQCSLEPLKQYCGFFLCNIVPGVLRQHCTGFFLCMLSVASRTTLHRVLTCAILFQRYWDNNDQNFSFVMSGASRTTLHRDLFNLCKVVQGVLRQHCRRFFPVQLCPKSIKTRFNKIFSDALSSSASRTTLHRVLTCARLSLEY